MTNEPNNFDKTIKNLKNKGLIPEDTKIIDEIKEEDYNKFRAIEGRVKEFRIILTPPINLEKFYDQDEDIEFERGIFFHMGKMSIYLDSGFMYKDGTGIKSQEEHGKDFNKVIAFFNIFGIPYDFITYRDVQYVIETKKKQEFTLEWSKRGEKLARTFEPIFISNNNQIKISIILSVMYQEIEKSGILDIGDIYVFLGYCNYYLFHENYLLSFLNGWIFIEAMIDFLWVKNIEKINKKIKNNKEWTAFIKIEELFMLKVINKNLHDDLNRLRKKRNNVFHVDINPNKRNVNKKESKDCFFTGWRLLNIAINFKKDGIYYFNDIQDEFYNKLHMPIKSNSK